MKTIIAVAVALVAAFNLASAKENYKESAFNADTRDKFESVSSNVRKELEKGGRYEYVKPEERRQIDQKLTDMSAAFNESGSVQTMKEDTKIKLFNDQEVINSILTKRDKDRVICTKQAPIGSHIPVTSCHTYGQEEDARRGTRDQLDKWKQAPCIGAPSPGSPHPACNMSSSQGS